MSSRNIIFLLKPKVQKIREILLFTLSVLAFVLCFKEYDSNNFLLNEWLFGYMYIFGLIAVFLFITIIAPLKIHIKNYSLYIKYLPKLYKRLSFEDVLNIIPITDRKFNLFEKWWYGIYSYENLYLISTRYRNYYINCKSDSINTIERLINELNSAKGSS